MFKTTLLILVLSVSSSAQIRMAGFKKAVVFFNEQPHVRDPQPPAPKQQSQQDADSHGNPAFRAEFPLVVEVSKSEYDNPFENDMANLAKGEDMGLAPPILVILTATINGESHWVLMCRRENVRDEINLCTPLAAGKYPARLVHNGELLQLLVKDDQGAFDWRFFDVSPKAQDPPPSDDAVLQTRHYQFVSVPTESSKASDYPMLLHVYGAIRLRLPVGSRPPRTHCTFTSYSSYSTQMSCVNSGGAEIYKGHVDLDSTLDGNWGWTISCDAKWRSKCAALGPGFYAARWKDTDRRQLIALAQVGDKVQELNFDAKKHPNLAEPAAAQPPLH